MQTGGTTPHSPETVLPLISVQQVSKIYTLGEHRVTALNSISVSIHAGDFVAIMGPSGSGKSTFMNIIGCLDRPSSGTYYLNGQDVGTLSRDCLAEIRNKTIGFVFQGFNLLPRTTALENVELPLLYNGTPAHERRERALEALRVVGLGDRWHHYPNQLSGGQQQRVTIARAIVNNASIVLADEPTGNLDTKTSMEIMELFVRLNQTAGITIIVVTHEPDIAAYGRRLIRFLDGVIVGDEVKGVA
ncbi:MAG: ABC transporter ATP-binding protein [Desulfobacterota bacterium]|nr:ABC transporter ATP-binding protein [Thermodesulfobacteriota bacterium]